MLKFVVASLFASLSLGINTASAQDNSGSNYETTVRASSFQSTSRIVIDEATIKKSKAPNVTNLLASQANISIASTNVQPSTVFLRGGDSSHLLIIVDGIPVFDGSTIQRTTNLNNIDIKSIRRIEVLKGPQSVLYGGQALAGVIKIETFPLELSDKVYAALEGGRFDYAKASVVGMKANEAKNTALLARGNWSQKRTISPIKNSDWKYDTDGNSGEISAIHRGDITSFVKISQINEKSYLPLTNNATQLPSDATDFLYKNRMSGVAAGISLPNVPVRPRLLVGSQNSLRTYVQPVLPASTQADDSYGSDLLNVRLEADLVSTDNSTLLLGASYQKESFVYRSYGVESKNEFLEYRGFFGKWTQDFGSLLGYEVGLRSDYISQQDRVDSIQFGLTIFEKIKLEYATGFKPPSLFQKYGMFASTLLPEKSKTYSLTYEDRMDERQFYSATIFDTHFDNLITYQATPSPGRYTNLSASQTRGIEMSYSIISESQFKTALNLGYQEPRDVTNAKWMIRRPLVTASLGFTQDWEKDSAGIEAVYTGTRMDRVAGADRRLASRTLLNANYAHQINDQFGVYARANNITDQRFEQTAAYFDEGFLGLIGIEFQN